MLLVHVLPAQVKVMLAVMSDLAIGVVVLSQLMMMTVLELIIYVVRNVLGVEMV